MEEQPVALAIINRSPNNWVNNLMYGVSPHPLHAPENSNKGSLTCMPRTLSVEMRARSKSGSERKNSQLVRSLSRIGNCGCMLIAFKRASDLFRAGQTSTQIPHPVQSSTATCKVYCSSFHSGRRADRDLNVGGAFVRRASS